MKIFALIAMSVLPGVASAQAFGGVQPTMSEPNFSTYQVMVENTYLPANTESAATKKYKLERAIALRDEVAVFLEQDGGVLTPKHQAYVRRKSRAILSYGR